MFYKSQSSIKTSLEKDMTGEKGVERNKIKKWREIINIIVFRFPNGTN